MLVLVCGAQVQTREPAQFGFITHDHPHRRQVAHLLARGRGDPRRACHTRTAGFLGVRARRRGLCLCLIVCLCLCLWKGPFAHTGLRVQVLHCGVQRTIGGFLSPSTRGKDSLVVKVLKSESFFFKDSTTTRLVRLPKRGCSWGPGATTGIAATKRG